MFKIKKHSFPPPKSCPEIQSSKQSKSRLLPWKLGEGSYILEPSVQVTAAKSSATVVFLNSDFLKCWSSPHIIFQMMLAHPLLLHNIPRLVEESLDGWVTFLRGYDRCKVCKHLWFNCAEIFIHRWRDKGQRREATSTRSRRRETQRHSSLDPCSGELLCLHRGLAEIF